MKINSLTRVLGIQVSFICAGLNASIGAMWTLVGLISRVAHLVTSKRIMISCYVLTLVTMEWFLTCAEEICQVKMKVLLDIYCSSLPFPSTVTRQCYFSVLFLVRWLPTWPLNTQTQPWKHLRKKERKKEREMILLKTLHKFCQW